MTAESERQTNGGLVSHPGRKYCTRADARVTFRRPGESLSCEWAETGWPHDITGMKRVEGDKARL